MRDGANIITDLRRRAAERYEKERQQGIPNSSVFLPLFINKLTHPPERLELEDIYNEQLCLCLEDDQKHELNEEQKKEVARLKSIIAVKTLVREIFLTEVASAADVINFLKAVIDDFEQPNEKGGKT